MHLLGMRVSGLGPFDELELSFSKDDGEPRLATVIHGGGGVGKTTLLAALASTRPGNAVVNSTVGSERETPGTAICEFRLGQDDPERPHVLVVTSPNARGCSDDNDEMLRRREQTFFDRVARETGFVFVAMGSQRWFSRQPVALIGPGRTASRYEVRSAITSEDPSRGEIGRETKQALTYATICGALCGKDPTRRRFEWLAQAMTQAVDAMAGLAGFRYIGIDPLTLEPQFTDEVERQRPFDSLPTRVRHLVAFVALPIRALWSAYPYRNPLESEGIVVIDEVDLLQDPATLAHLVPALRQAIPQMQWILSATSPLVAASCEASEVIALRRNPERNHIEHFTGPQAFTH